MWLLVIAGCTPPQGFPRSPEIAAGNVTFRYRAPGARVVQVSGSWETNFYLQGRDWTRDTRVGLMQASGGVWELAVPLGPGRYEYVFLVDGQMWEVDPANPQRDQDLEGRPVSIVVVP